MVNKIKSDQKKRVFITSIILLIILVEFCGAMFFSNYIKIRKYNNKIYPNTYLGDYKISEVGFVYLEKRIEFYTDSILNNTIIIKCHGKDYKYTFKDLNLEIDKEGIIKDIIDDQKSLKYDDKLQRVKGQKKIYNYKLKYDEKYLRKFLEDLKLQTDVNVVYDNLVMSPDREFSYSPGVEGYTLNIDDSLKELIDSIENRATDNLEVSLVGDVIEPGKNKQLQLIDSKVSSFVTEFNPYISRGTNLKTGLGYIDGAIIQPGEIFSFYDYAGPYNKSGYVFYYEFVGNGVCQIATTVYNAALLGGLEIVKRYPHAAKSVYVPGGLDATVASYASGWYVDFQFKNTYDYPIYISAYAVGGEAHVDFWSNHDAKKGKTYQTESVQIAPRGYKTYLHVYENGQEIENRYITTTYYSKDK